MGRGPGEQCLKLCFWGRYRYKGHLSHLPAPWSPLDTQTPRHLEDIMRWGKYMLGTIVVQLLCPTPRPRRLQHARLSGPSLSPGVCSPSCPLS